MSNVTTIGEHGCESMFNGCSSLTTPPDMSNVTTIGYNGCYNMFNNCKKLTKAVELNSLNPNNITSSNKDVFKEMYKGCTSLTEGIIYNVENSGNGYTSGDNIYKGCTNLQNVKVYGNMKYTSSTTLYDYLYSDGHIDDTPITYYILLPNGAFSGVTNSVNLYIMVNESESIKFPISVTKEGVTDISNTSAIPRWFNIFIVN